MADNITIYRGRRAKGSRRFWCYVLLLLLLGGVGWAVQHLLARGSALLAVASRPAALAVVAPTVYEETPPLTVTAPTAYPATSATLSLPPSATYEQPEIIAVPPPSDYDLSSQVVVQLPANYDAPPVTAALPLPPPEDIPVAEKIPAAVGRLDKREFYVSVPRATKQLRICVRDHSCQDGDRVRLSINGKAIYEGEIFKNPKCATATVREGENLLNLYAINGSGGKGRCSYLPINTGQVLISSIEWQSAKWELAPGKSAISKIHVTLE